MEDFDDLQVKDIAVKAFFKLIEMRDKYDHYTYIEISFSDYDRAYICLLPMLPGHAAIHEEYNMDSCSNNTRVVTIEVVVKYIRNHPRIIYVGLFGEDPKEPEKYTDLYKQ